MFWKFKRKCAQITKEIPKIKKKEIVNMGDNLWNVRSRFEKTSVNVRKAGRK